MAKYCHECGSELVPGAKFCSNCATPVPDQVQADASPTAGATYQSAAAQPEANAQNDTEAWINSKNAGHTASDDAYANSAANAAVGAGAGFAGAGGAGFADGPEGAGTNSQAASYWSGNASQASYANAGNAAGATYDNGVPQRTENQQTMLLVAFILNVVSTVSVCWLLIPLAWMIPMTVHSYNIYKGKCKNTCAFSICTLLFLNLISGILGLVSGDE